MWQSLVQRKDSVITYNSQGKYGRRNEISEFINYIPKEFLKLYNFYNRLLFKGLLIF